jgi:uncharacterized protein YkwD
VQSGRGSATRRALRAAIATTLVVSGLLGAPSARGANANTIAAQAATRAHAWGTAFASTTHAVPQTPGPPSATPAAKARTITASAPSRAHAWDTAFASTTNTSPSRTRPLPTRICGGVNLQPTRANLQRVTAATRCLIEREREAGRVGLLHSNGSLEHIAASQAKEMVIGDYFGDNSLSGSTPMQRIEVSAYASRTKSLLAAQNIGWGTGVLATPTAMVRGWMLSPPHRHIMLTGRYRDIGVGIAPAAPPRLTDGLPGATYTVEFATRK